MGDLKVRFLPEGGFDKNGAFIEYEGEEPSGDETEYQRQGYLTVDLACKNMLLGTRYSVFNETEEDPNREAGRTITATGVIQSARWGRFALSKLGDQWETHEVDVVLRENDRGEAARMFGTFFDGDLDIEGQSSFFLQVEVHTQRFATLLKELAAPGAQLRLSVDVHQFRGFYARWSPAISEGRTIKFLNNKRDVENADEISEDFWTIPESMRWEILDQDPPVTISVGRPLQHAAHSPASPEDDNDWDLDEDMPPPSVPPMPAQAPNLVPALEELTKRVRRGAFGVTLWLALIFLALILSL